MHVTELHEVRTINRGLADLAKLGFDVQALIPQERTGVEAPRYVLRRGDSEIPDDLTYPYNNVLSLRAPGDIRMSNPILIVGDDYYRARGTSMAAPHVSGVAALILSAFADASVVEKALVCGASGFISKASPRKVLISAVMRALEGVLVVPSEFSRAKGAGGDEIRTLTKRLRSLTPQQLRVLEMLCQGLLNKQIAFALEVGETTVKAHVSEILRKLSVTSRTQAVLEVSKLDFGAVPALYEGEGGDDDDVAGLS